MLATNVNVVRRAVAELRIYHSSHSNRRIARLKLTVPGVVHPPVFIPENPGGSRLNQPVSFQCAEMLEPIKQRRTAANSAGGICVSLLVIVKLILIGNLNADLLGYRRVEAHPRNVSDIVCVGLESCRRRDCSELHCAFLSGDELVRQFPFESLREGVLYAQAGDMTVVRRIIAAVFVVTEIERVIKTNQGLIQRQIYS